jgi:hypothetical protein
MGMAAQCGKDGGNKVTRSLGTSMMNLVAAHAFRKKAIARAGNMLLNM